MTNLPYPSLKNLDIAGKTVLVRAGFDLPMEDGEVLDTSRVEALLPTFRHILEAGSALVLLAHQGRPKGEPNPEFSQKPLVPVLQKFLDREVKFAELGDEAKLQASALKPGEVLLLENIRFDPREKSKDAAERDELGQELAELADVYVNDAFTNCHRDHASMTSVPKYLPGCIGLHLEEELQHLAAVDDPRRPVTLIISGAKMETKVPVIEHFLDKGDDILLGGLIANTFIAARGFSLGASLFEHAAIETAQNIMLESEKIENAMVHVPRDVVVAEEPTEGAAELDLPVEDVEGDMKVFDVGRATVARYAEIVKKSGTIIWNGPLGMYEVEDFAGSSKILAQAVAEATANGATSLIGGGDTIDFHNRYGLPLDKYSWVSMGGGAMLECISGKELPALTALQK